MKKYFLHDGSQQTGPFDIEELKLKNLNRDTPIWFEGLDEWTAIGKVDELKEIITATPPPFATKISSPLPVQKPATQTKMSVDGPKQSSSLGRRVLILGAIIILGLIGFYIYNQVQHQQYQNERQERVNAEEDTKAMIRNNITSYVTAEKSDYTYSKLGGIYNLKISVTNNTHYLIDNVKVKVFYMKANGVVWNSRIIDFNLLNPQTKSTIKVPDTERGTRVKYEIFSIKSTALGLN
jgi:hypothetical protein